MRCCLLGRLLARAIQHQACEQSIGDDDNELLRPLKAALASKAGVTQSLMTVGQQALGILS